MFKNFLGITSLGTHISSALEDENGSKSTMRLITLLWMTVLCFGMAFLIFKNSAFPIIPDSIVYITCAVVLGKIGQKYQELNVKEKKE